MLKIEGAVAEVVAVIQAQNHAGVWDIQARVPPGIATTDHAALVMQLIKPDGNVLQSNEVSLAIEAVTDNQE
jgi:hypothetical protein